MPTLKRRFRAVIAAFIFFSLLICICPSYATRDDGQRMVKVGATRLHMNVGGGGAATVVLEAGFNSTSESWAKVQPEVAKFARVVSYDRAGLGKSEAGEKPRTGMRIVSELHEALKKAGLKPPFVLVGHSAGGAFVRIYAHEYPKDVAAIVLVDPPQEELLAWLKEHAPERYGMPAEALKQLPEGVRAEWEGREAQIEELRAAWPLPRVPVVLLTSERNDQSLSSEVSPEALKVLLDARQKWLERIPTARQVIAHKSGHNIPRDEPELIVEAIKEVVGETMKKPS